MAKAFASTGDTAEKTISFSEIGDDLYAFTTEGDPNTGVIIGDDSVMVIDTQATPVMAQQVIERVKGVTDKPIKYVTLSHYHAVRVLGASAYGASEIIASEKCRAMIHERGQEDWDSEYARFPRLFQAADSIPGLTWPTVTFREKMTVYMGKRRVDLMFLGRAHTAGDIVAWVPDAGVMFTGDIVEYHSACYCGDGHFNDWPGTLAAIRRYDAEAIMPGRGDAVVGTAKVGDALDLTEDFVMSTYRPVARVAARGGSLKDAFEACRAECDRKFSNYAIYEHCLPFNVARAYDEALGIDTPRIWTAERDQQMWNALQGDG
ncbi:MAG: MBL fold metallo-hydrolase [Alphaproteobacteria bacterium]|nr:MBL fold metallo-hydrolase [Alphaproteobacteria bacterium]